MKTIIPLRRPSLRLKDYDYRQTGAYFITICAKDHSGRIVHKEWLNLAKLRANIELDEFVIMPNHFHAILWILGEEVGTASRAPTVEQFGQPVSGSLSSIIRGYKSGVLKRINEMHHSHRKTVWQRSFYEHVIRNEESLNRIRGYIATNPLRWELDKENPMGTGEDDFDLWLAKL
jgi:REP element-mobilizing transposase RayT